MMQKNQQSWPHKMNLPLQTTFKAEALKIQVDSYKYYASTVQVFLDKLRQTDLK